ncbi:MAG: X-Pro dipeptidyl-peptidase, partial [Ignavibacteriales bacterium]|nr:X-Pro dipeptidyl-peptidase [Ignavibacteriales bacterium]
MISLVYRKRFLFLIITVTFCQTFLWAQRDAYVRAHYTKSEYQIPMRDGVKLFTAVYVPKDTSQPYPIMLNRTPYSVAPYGPDFYRPLLGPSELFDKEGYIFVLQDVRGK